MNDWGSSAPESRESVTEPGTPGPIPPGTRDVLPDEMRELRRIEEVIRGEFERSGYLEVRTPSIEYTELLSRSGRRGGPLYRFLDDRGELVALRNDMTVPIARLAAARLGETEPPWRLAYLGQSFRTTSPRRADLRESGQAGVELIGPVGPAGTAEVLGVLDRSLSGVGVDRAVVSIGDATLWPGILGDTGLDPAVRDRCLAALGAGDLVEFERLLGDGGVPADDLVGLARTRGDTEAIERLREVGGATGTEVASRLGELAGTLGEGAIAAKVVFDLGMVRDPDYYSGEVFEVYAEGLGRSLGGGGRYDGLMDQLGVSLPAAGFSLVLERIHESLIETGGPS